MPSSLEHSVEMMRVSHQKPAGFAPICIVCFLCVLASASAQSQTTHYRSYSSTHYRSASRTHYVDKKPQSLPSSAVSDVAGKPSGRAANSPNKELDQLERGSIMKSMSAKRATPAPAKGTLARETHSAPINFTHKELPQSSRSGPAKIR